MGCVKNVRPRLKPRTRPAGANSGANYSLQIVETAVGAQKAVSTSKVFCVKGFLRQAASRLSGFNIKRISERAFLKSAVKSDSIATYDLCKL
jgi:hypothetical protein